MANFYAPGFDQQVEQQNIDRQRQYAQALRKQSSEMPDGRMVGKTYVAPSWTEGLAQLLQSYQGGQAERGADEKQKALAAAVSGRTAQEWGKIAPLLTGTQASEGMPANEMDSGSDMGAVKAQAPNVQGAYAAAMQSQDPALKQFGLSGMAQLPQIEAQKQERLDNRAFRQQESEATRAARAEELRLRMEDGRASQLERLAAQKELREMQIQAQKDTQRMIAANRPASQAQIIQTENGPMQLVGGKAVPIVGPDGKQVANKMTAKASGPMSVTLQKELLESDDAVQSTKAVVDTLKNALKINKDAYSGYFAKGRAVAASNLVPWATKGADATVDLDNMMTGQALESLKTVFGGMPTEGERKILLDMQASADKTPTQREAIMNRAISAAERRGGYAQEKAKSIRGGSYLTDGVPVAADSVDSLLEKYK